ncbi:hypothetical protein FHX34_102802 [Actinoplanes teichomyceticus]|uniref:Uncharacterized protein n=2 Tax=Actinoplanes teichomyceticus TaxID=1867 RepID=A0A561WK46_ACTTI|nr:hypothetical protein FHX34_102802 [Actinoplanes teichomyceticus]
MRADRDAASRPRRPRAAWASSGGEDPRRLARAQPETMNVPAERSASAPSRALYQLRLAGLIPPDLVGDIEGLRITEEPAETVLCGELADQSALFGLLARIHGLGLQLLEVRRLTDVDAEDPPFVPDR